MILYSWWKCFFEKNIHKLNGSGRKLHQLFADARQVVCHKNLPERWKYVREKFMKVPKHYIKFASKIIWMRKEIEFCLLIGCILANNIYKITQSTAENKGNYDFVVWGEIIEKHKYTLWLENLFTCFLYAYPNWKENRSLPNLDRDYYISRLSVL